MTDSKSSQGKLFISIYWKCCGVYSRIYKDKSGATYEGRCPRCGAFLSVPVGAGGTTRRMFIADKK